MKGGRLSAPVDSATDSSRQTKYVSDVAAYRHDFRNWLNELDWADEWRSIAFDTAEDELAYHATVLSRVYDAGWNRYGWPQAAGGFGGTELHRAAYFDELAAAMLPVPEQHWTLEVLGPALVKYAPDLAAEHLPNYFRGAEWWGQCFSEPEAGSDLAALRCRATDDGAGGFVLNGQKIWTSQGPDREAFPAARADRHPGEQAPRPEHVPGRRGHPWRHRTTGHAGQRTPRTGRGVLR